MLKNRNLKTHAMVLLATMMFVTASAQTSQLPTVAIKDLQGKQAGFPSLFNAGSDSIYIVSLWATWCVPCVRELDAISENLSDWQRQLPLKLIGVSTDDTRTSSRVKGFVAGRGWDFSIYLDVNSDLKRALNVSNIPFLFVIKNGKIVHQQEGYLPGGEETLFEKLQQLKSK
jgi:cytochrome c biogenesis protein CcmG, thiol:disulfide interchange protein DsbE